ncbi:MAG: DUF2066 domain-containing protein [Gammaproteobacteria bacterium]|nr:DUF2066 domain-containing protein [Gammaproteobacteria bacterium]
MRTQNFSGSQRPWQQYFSTMSLLLVAFILAISAGPVVANQGQLSDLLRGEIAVEGQTRTERQRQLPIIFRDVLVRLTGTTEVLDQDRVRAELRQVNDYLLQFGYEQRDGQLYLQVSFDETRVRQLLQQANVPIWTGQRPNLLLWLAEDHPERGVRLVTRSEERDFLQLMRQTMQRRGVEFLMPLMDLEDQLSIGARDVWGRFQREVIRASERYPVNGIVSARMYRQLGNDYEEQDTDYTEIADLDVSAETIENLPIVLEVTVLVGDNSFNEFFVANTEGELAEKFVNTVSDRIAALFISREDSELATIWVRMHNLRQLSQVLAAESMLQQQAQVQRVHLQGYQQGVADFQVQVRGGAAALATALDFERRVRRTALREQRQDFEQLTEESGDAQQPAVREPDVEFQWQ